MSNESLRWLYVAALIHRVREGDTSLMERIERLLDLNVFEDEGEAVTPSIEGSAPLDSGSAPLEPAWTPEELPAPSLEMTPEIDIPVVRRVISTMSEEEQAAWAEKQSTAVAPVERPHRSALIGLQPTVEPAGPRCPDCGASVSAEGKRCRKCAGAVRRQQSQSNTRTKSDGQTSTRNGHKGIVIPPRPAAAVTTAEPVAPDEELPECTCVQKTGVPEPGFWHEKECPRHVHRWVIDSVSDGHGVFASKCKGCGEPKEHRPYEAEEAYRLGKKPVGVTA